MVHIYTVDKPVHMSKQDIYKFAMYTLLSKDFNLLSGQYISAIGCRIMKLDKKDFKNHIMGTLKLESYLLNKQRPINPIQTGIF